MMDECSGRDGMQWVKSGLRSTRVDGFQEVKRKPDFALLTIKHAAVSDQA
jgi:hypothetical protein